MQTVANKKNKNYKLRFSKLSSTTKSILYVTLTILSAILLWYAYRIIDTNLQVKRLDYAEIKFDELNQRIKETGLDVQTYRDEFCWRTQDKLSEGTRYCEQRLVVVGRNKDIPAQVSESEVIVKELEKSFGAKLYNEDFSKYSDTGVVRLNMSLSGYDNRLINCHSTYVALDGSRDYDVLSRDIYSFDVICSEINSLYDLYPYTGKGHPVWRNYLK